MYRACALDRFLTKLYFLENEALNRSLVTHTVYSYQIDT